MIDKNSDYRHWSLPELDGSEAEETQETTLFGKPANWYHREKETVEQEVEEQPLPLTLDDIEAVRQSAYEDGFKEGKDAGFAQGMEEGKVQGLSEGLQQGIEQGTVQGLSEGQAQIEKQISSWQLLIERLHNPLEKLDDNVEYQLIRLATMLAEQITRCEVQSNPQIILQALKQGVEALPVSEQTLKILLHPDDLAFVQDAFSPEVCLQRGWDLQSEPALARGDCQIHTQTSSVDYAFSTRIEQVLKHFFQENHTQLPQKNDDSNLLNDHPLENITAVSKQENPAAAEAAGSDKEVINE
ncbi:flagellar assembly protein FliH [Psychromonas aquimarina]|uniref:flagellar assembly protein FliH n=1 Tax=Psychromonas aquimarina TaxID=444919 RepID=UPI00040AF2B9|nr:flagellar assembly protein FliH [Psychromonas aquimarina]